MKKDSKISLAFVFRLIGVLMIVTFLLSMLWVVYYTRFDVRKTPQMMLYSFDNKPDSLKVDYQWVALDSVSRNMVVAILAAEDKDFYIHEGFAPLNDHDSVVSIIPRKHETITQKAAHSTFLTVGDSWAKDILEPYFCVLEEYLWGKDRILEIYLNTVPFGHGIFGVEAASRIYFNKSAGDLTTQEAALLAALLESPETIDIENTGQEAIDRQNNILLEMAQMMHIKIGKDPVDEKEKMPAKPIYRRKWRG